MNFRKADVIPGIQKGKKNKANSTHGENITVYLYPSGASSSLGGHRAASGEGQGQKGGEKSLSRVCLLPAILKRRNDSHRKGEGTHHPLSGRMKRGARSMADCETPPHQQHAAPATAHRAQPGSSERPS